MSDMFTRVSFDDLVEQAVHRAAGCRSEMKHFLAVGIGLKRALNGLDLSCNASNPLQQLVFVLRKMRHTHTPYRYLA
ncbi:hypothetical protein AWB75_06971 [Caballeronia catudaia]|uniref:Uncharacterized protein n=1 Tax=Caballeronia catudaia TaxID=1777136 RepID=A0A158DN15_9BURK|nr:hypothetical protein AWB75_06971 [Caballeronia catudaia]